ncbi:3-deoxy-D-manno-octulosonic acid transferase [Geobacter argillaceus]|uniref:3-deoxy-D-manno-octulosonic acid transferase n=1 Tax=Geobacter argillaceus TaxID=345631 RepID=A0A562VND0_9BACT|nr:3-deoxy-D-manno-octulosonic acid transferase [Geobacter argillaceus]TWJ19281.1 3-deoxy-D-manno-octulosonic-acid transferase [Geobacter argillaceus]
MYVLYNILLWLALPFILAYHLYRSVSRGRPAAFGERFGFVDNAITAPVAGRSPIWVHAVSVGETIAAKPLLKGLKERWPNRPLILSNMTETGRAIGQGIRDVDLALHFPFDYPFAVRSLLSRVRPALIVIVETEIWPNFVRIARERGIPVVMVNGRISDRSYSRYLRLRRFFGPILAHFSALCMQSAEDGRRIAAIGADPARVFVAGNLKYDIAVIVPTPDERLAIRTAYRLPPEALVVTAGSTHPGEEVLVIAAFRALLAAGLPVVLVLVPRHPERADEVAGLLEKADRAYVRRSGLGAATPLIAPGRVLLVDTIGELMRLYAVSDLVFVGGSLVPVGGHNLLEPASLGVPVVFGPYMENFREISRLALAGEGGVQVADESALGAALATLLQDADRRLTMGERGRRIVAENGGATERHLEVIERLLDERPART